MSMYNAVLGENAFSGVLLSMLGFQTRGEIPRYRDCWWNGEHIAVHTRVGGGNRNDYVERIVSMQMHEGYVKDEDDDYDHTFATFYYKFPEQYNHWLPAIKPETRSTRERWEDMMRRIENPEGDEEAQRAIANMAPTIAALQKAIDDPNGSGIIHV